jgi:hypothetical protein
MEGVITVTVGHEEARPLKPLGGDQVEKRYF